ncbi:helix-turn-helix transcriptional regulator [Kaustia mangrovi]|uniref:Helix-turn-helix transcriptional regulator n=1 Tax=Kaustia mangrovi TaxID=2593653 RepID=A0A7S8C7V1_9HYPH|nr:helix-turn-helix transcriptional regulator [Kaustia mangrovi]QPC44987.1 helix-turn-helix transcriptional regulator [Kaustia mangrovi]
MTVQSRDRKGFTDRLRVLLEDRSARSFAIEAGIAPTTFAKVVKRESDPTRTTLAAIADAADVSLDWLVCGRGAMRRSDAATANQQSRHVTVEILEECIRLVDEWLARNERQMPADKKAQVVSMLYDMVAENAASGQHRVDPRRVEKLLRLVA